MSLSYGFVAGVSRIRQEQKLGSHTLLADPSYKGMLRDDPPSVAARQLTAVSRKPSAVSGRRSSVSSRWKDLPQDCGQLLLFGVLLIHIIGDEG